MSGARLAFLDWLKVAGMALIIFGHTGGDGASCTAPFYPKQLGVAFFVYAMGYTLAQERRSAGRILYQRLFDVYLIGLLCAIGIAAISWWQFGKLSKSNFLPFLLGVNTLYNFFPANPTTWFIGAYLHLLLVGVFVFRRVPWNAGWLAGAAVAEVALRSVAMHFVGDFFAYMSVANWMTALGIGFWAGQAAHSGTLAESAPRRWPAIAIMLGVLFIWPWTVGQLAWDDGFPFRRLTSLNVGTADLVSAACVTSLYLAYTCGGAAIARELPRWTLIEFLARHTLLVFVLHMPLVYAISPTLYRLVPEGFFRHVLHQVLYFGGLATASAILYRVARLRACRDWLGIRLGFNSLVSSGEPSSAESSR